MTMIMMMIKKNVYIKMNDVFVLLLLLLLLLCLSSLVFFLFGIDYLDIGRFCVLFSHNTHNYVLYLCFTTIFLPNFYQQRKKREREQEREEEEGIIMCVYIFVFSLASSSSSEEEEEEERKRATKTL